MDAGDLKILKKESPEGLQFLFKASQYNSWYLLSQVLTDYYGGNGGVQGFDEDIVRMETH